MRNPHMHNMLNYTTAPVLGEDLREGDVLREQGKTIQLDHDPIRMENGSGALSVNIYVRGEDGTWPKSVRWWVLMPTDHKQLIDRVGSSEEGGR